MIYGGIGMDELIKAMDSERQIRVVMARTTSMVNELAERHQMSATVRAASGRLITGALLLASDLKAGKGLTVQVNGGGSVGDIVAVAEPEGTARLYVENPEVDVPSKYPGKLDVGRLVGNDGYFRVIKDLGLKQPFIGTVPLQTGEIADDLAYYLLNSEQVASLVALGVLVDTDLSVLASGGLLIQALPGASDEKLAAIEEKVNGAGPLSSLMAKYDNLEELIELFMGMQAYEILERTPLAFKCRCSAGKIESIIRSLPPEDIELSLEELGMVEVKCNFCNEIYAYGQEEVEQLRAQLS